MRSNKFWAWVGIIFIAVVLTGSGALYAFKDGALGQWASHVKSAVVGLNRTATVYNLGSNVPVKVYQFNSQVEYKSTSVRFLANGKVVNITGGLVIIEED